MEKIPVSEDRPQESVSNINRIYNTKKSKTIKSMISYGGLVLGVLIVIAFMLVSTANVKFQEISDEGWSLKDALVTLAIYIFAEVAVHAACMDSGTRAGLINPIYTGAVSKYNELKAKIVEEDYHEYANEFCQEYAKEEQIRTRTRILANVGITHATYLDRYIALDAKELAKKYPSLSKNEISAIVKANSVERIVLTPEMLLKRGRAGDGRNPLGRSPEARKNIHLVSTVIRLIASATLISLFAAEVLVSPTWQKFVEAAFKAVIITFQGAMGYRFGFDNIVSYSSDYITDQTDLLDQLIKFAETKRAEQAL